MKTHLAIQKFLDNRRAQNLKPKSIAWYEAELKRFAGAYRDLPTEPIPLYRAYRIASYMVVDYYRQQRKLNTGLDCKNCSKAQRAKCQKGDLYSQCPKLIKLEYLEAEHLDQEGNRVTILDTLADDKAIDLDAWLDASTWLAGCKVRLIEIATKLNDGIELTKSEQNSLYHFRNRELKKTQKSLF